MNDSVYLAVCGKFHAFHLAREYAREHRLGAIFCSDQRLSPPRGIPREAYRNKSWIKYWRILSAKSGVAFGHSFDRESLYFDRWLKGQMRPLPGGIFHGWNGHIGNTLRALDSSRWLRCVERSCPHNQFQHDLLVEEAGRLGLPYEKRPETLQAAIAELETADLIVAPSTYSARSYEGTGLEHKVRINPLGANLTLRPLRRKDGPLKILCVGNNFLRKGIHYLIQAFSMIEDEDAQLILRADVPKAYRSRITDERVTIVPPVPYARLEALFEEATLFCLPSIDEGFGMVALEALSHGLPLIVTENCGVADLLGPEVAECVPVREPDAIHAAIQGIRAWTEESYRRFDQHRAEVIAENTWTACARRMFKDVYQRTPEMALSW